MFTILTFSEGKIHFMTSHLGEFSDHLLHWIYQAHSDKCMLS